MTSATPRVWIDPWRYYAATALMTPEQVEAVLQEISTIAESGAVEELRKYDFVVIENPYLAWRRARQHHAD